MLIRRLIQKYVNLNDEGQRNVDTLTDLLFRSPSYRRAPLLPVDVPPPIDRRSAVLAESHRTISQPSAPLAFPKPVAKVIQARPRPALVHRK